MNVAINGSRGRLRSVDERVGAEDQDRTSVLLERIRELEAEAAALKERRDILNGKAREWAEKRDQLNSQRREAWKRVMGLKEERDGFNRMLREVKEGLRRLRDGGAGLREKHETLMMKVASLRRRVLYSEEETKKQVESLDWRIQTTPMSPAEEGAIIGQIKNLEQELIIHREIRKTEEEIAEAKRQIGLLKARGYEDRRKMADFVAKGQECHIKMVDEIKMADALKEAADRAHQEYLRCLKEADQNHARYREVMGRVIEAEEEVSKLVGESRRRLVQQAAEAQERASEAAYRKFKEGKKLTMGELKLLMEKGLV